MQITPPPLLDALIAKLLNACPAHLKKVKMPSADFLAAAEDVKHLPEKPGNDVLLQICKCGVNVKLTN
jgi:hypothetical protein